MPKTERDHAAEYAARKDRRWELYRRRRLALITRLGGRCVDCGTTEAAVLEFDHLHERTWVARETHVSVRIHRYEQEAGDGLIELRCRSCNARKGRPAAEWDAPEFSEEGLADF